MSETIWISNERQQNPYFLYFWSRKTGLICPKLYCTYTGGKGCQLNGWKVKVCEIYSADIFDLSWESDGTPHWTHSNLETLSSLVDSLINKWLLQFEQPFFKLTNIWSVNDETAIRFFPQILKLGLPSKFYNPKIFAKK